jgi:hypothetical protein
VRPEVSNGLPALSESFLKASDALGKEMTGQITGSDSSQAEIY